MAFPSSWVHAGGRMLRLAAVLSASSPCGKAVQAMAAHVAKSSAGRLSIDLNMDGSIGGTNEMVRGLVDGSIDIVMGGIDILGAEFKDAVIPLDLTDMPYLFANAAQARHAVDGALGKYRDEMMRSWNIVVLGWPENGMRHMTANKPIRNLADMRGLKLRLTQSKVALETFGAMGATPGALPFSQLKEALRTGRFEAQENPIGNIVGAKLNELQSHISLTGHQYSTQFIAMPLAVWKELSAGERQWLQAGARAGVAVSRSENERIDEQGLQQLASAGMVVVKDIDRVSMSQGASRAMGHLSSLYGADVITRIRKLAA